MGTAGAFWEAMLQTDLTNGIVFLAAERVYAFEDAVTSLKFGGARRSGCGCMLFDEEAASVSERLPAAIREQTRGVRGMTRIPIAMLVSFSRWQDFGVPDLVTPSRWGRARRFSLARYGIRRSSQAPHMDLAASQQPGCNSVPGGCRQPRAFGLTL